MKRIIPIVGLGLGAGTSAAIAMIAVAATIFVAISMTTVAGIFISAPTRAGTRTGGSGLATTQRVWRVMTKRS